MDTIRANTHFSKLRYKVLSPWNLGMARIPSFFSYLYHRQNPKSFHCTNPQIRNLSSDKANGYSNETLQHSRKLDEVTAQDRVFSISTADDRVAEESTGKTPRTPDEKLASVTEIAKEVSNHIRTRPRWEQTLVNDFPAVNFADPIVYNEVLKLQSNVLLSLRFYFWLKSLNGFSPDPALGNVMFSKLVQAKAANAAKNILDDTKFEPNGLHSESYVKCLFENGLVDEAVDAFERLKKSSGYRVSLETWNWALCQSVRNKRVDVVWKLYEDMMAIGVVTDVNTIGYLIQAFCLENNADKGYELLQQVLEAGHVPDNIVFIKLVSAFGKNRDYAKISAVLNNMIAKNRAPDIYTYQEVIYRLCNGRMIHEALRIFNELKNRGYFPDRVMYTTMINGLCKNKETEIAQKLWFEMIDNGIVPDEYTYNAFIDGLYRSECIDEADKLHKDMLEKGYRETTISFNTRIKGLCLNGKAEEARALFEEMDEKGIVQDSITYNSLIKGFSQQGNIMEGMYFFNELLKKGFKPLNASFSTLIEKLCEVGHVKEAETLWLDMRDMGFEPAVHSLEPIVLELGKRGHFLEVMKYLDYLIDNRVRPKETTFEEIIKRLFAAKRVDKALVVLDSMLSIGFVLGESVCHFVVDELCRDNLQNIETSLEKILERR